MVRGLVNGQGPIGHVVKRAKLGFSSCLSAVTAFVGSLSLSLSMSCYWSLHLVLDRLSNVQRWSSISCVLWGSPSSGGHNDKGKHYIIRVGTQYTKADHMVRVRLSNRQKVPLLPVSAVFFSVSVLQVASVTKSIF